MKHSVLHKIFLTLLSLNIVYAHVNIPSSTYTYVIKTDSDQNDPVHITCTYKGCVLDLRDGIDFLPEAELINNFTIIITPEHPRVSSGTVSHLERVPDVECLWFDVSWAKEGTRTVWSIEQRAQQEMPFRIPHDAIIICYPIEFVEKLDDRSSQESSTILHLPTLVLKKNLTLQEKTKRDNSLTRSILSNVDVNASLTPAKLVKKGNSIKTRMS